MRDVCSEIWCCATVCDPMGGAGLGWSPLSADPSPPHCWQEGSCCGHVSVGLCEELVGSCRVGSVPSPAPCCPPGPAGDGEGLCVTSSAAHSTGGPGELEIPIVLSSRWVFLLFPFFYACNENLGQGYIFHPTFVCVKITAAVSNVGISLSVQ